MHCVNGYKRGNERNLEREPVMETGCPVLAYTEFPPPDTIEFFSDRASVSCEHVRHEFNNQE
jgi:hypothetical protein